jgi:uncharacterized protein (TIGR02996 family)
MTEEAAFIAAIRATPQDDTVRLVFADWLDERGDRRGALLRVLTQLRALERTAIPAAGGETAPALALLGKQLRELLPAVDREWVQAVLMLPESAYPGPLPLKGDPGLYLLDRLAEFDATQSVFLTFAMIPVVLRIGEWRYAGATTTLAEAVRQVERFTVAMGGEQEGVIPWLRQELETEGEEGWHFPSEPPVDVSGPHRLVLCVQGDAPYDDVGACIVEVVALASSGYEGRAPETDRPKEWCYVNE